MSKYKAVIFDLGGTLCRSIPWSKYEIAAAEMAKVCSVPVDDFVKLFFQEASCLSLGLFARYEDFVKYLLDKLRANTPENTIQKATEFSYSLTKEVVKPREGALEILTNLKNRRLKLGLISDCFFDVAEIWPETPFAPLFDTTVFSCNVKMNKANPEIFKIALEELGVKAEHCVYVADGARNELANAAALGMNSIQIFIPEERDNSPIREDWKGAMISSLKEILEFL